jgi:NAD(P)-dependent dehydrogenase (short-subunit alcohol dehydrogenase family)
LAERFAGALEVEKADIVQAGSVHALRDNLQGRSLDVMFVDAGIARSNDKTPVGVEDQDFADMMFTQALAPVRTVELLADPVPPDGVIAIMTSELGSIAQSGGFWSLYSSRKAALNMLMKGYAARRPDEARALLRPAGGEPRWAVRKRRCSRAPAGALTHLAARSFTCTWANISSGAAPDSPSGVARPNRCPRRYH